MALEDAPAGGLIVDGYASNSAVLTLDADQTPSANIKVSDSICLEPGQTLEIYARAYNTASDNPQAQWSLMVKNVDTMTYVHASDTLGNNRPKENTLIYKEVYSGATAAEYIVELNNNIDDDVPSTFQIGTV